MSGLLLLYIARLLWTNAVSMQKPYEGRLAQFCEILSNRGPAVNLANL